MDQPCSSCGELAAARAHQEQGLRLYDPQQHRAHAVLYSGHDPGVCCRYRWRRPSGSSGYPDQALASSQEALALAQELAHPFSLTLALYWAAVLHHLRREAPCPGTGRGCHGPRDRPGVSQRLAQGTVLRGWALAAQGQGEEGIAQIQQGLAAWRADGGDAGTDRITWPCSPRRMGRWGRPRRGSRRWPRRWRRCTTERRRWWEAELYRLRGELLLQQLRWHSQEEAEACFQQALAVARRQQAKSLELRAAMSLSRLWQQQGKRDEARELLAPIYGWFTEGFDTADLQEAKALLEELS